jgi:hypothetical protein
MGIFDFFKSKKDEPKKEKIKFEDIEHWLNDRTKRNLEKEQKIVKEITSLISETTKILEEQNVLLNKVDVKDRKEVEKLKGVVMENLSVYSHQLSKLISNLQNLKGDTLQEFLGDLNKTFIEFKQKSSTSFEKATILVGKELGDIKETLGEFTRGLNKVLDEEKEALELARNLISVKNKLNELRKFEDSKKNIFLEMKNIEESINNLETNSDLAKKELESIKLSVKYVSREQEKESAKLKKIELEKEIIGLRNLVDFKHLSRTFHEDPKKMALIHDYETDFNRLFEKGDEQMIIPLIEGSKKAQVLGKIEEIRETKLKIQEILGRKDLLEDSARNIMNLNASIKGSESDKLKLKKKMDKSEEDIATMQNEIKSALSTLNVEVE